MAQWDVFTAKRLEGNSVAVFPDARGLNDDEMQAIAREMNLAETTFVFPREQTIEREQGVRVRIFTVQEELPFAGHPTLGTAFALRGNGGAKEITLHLNVGKVPVQFDDASGPNVFGEMSQVAPVFGARHDCDAVAKATGINVEDFDRSLPIQTVSTGLSFTITPLKSLAAMQRLRIDAVGATNYLEQHNGKIGRAHV